METKSDKMDVRSFNEGMMKPDSINVAARRLNKPELVDQVCGIFDQLDFYVQTVLIISVLSMTEEQFNNIKDSYANLIACGEKSMDEWVRKTSELFKDYPNFKEAPPFPLTDLSSMRLTQAIDPFVPNEISQHPNITQHFNTKLQVPYRPSSENVQMPKEEQREKIAQLNQRPPPNRPIPPMGQQLPPMGMPVHQSAQPTQPINRPMPPMGQQIPPMGQQMPPMGQQMPPMGAPAPQQMPPMGQPIPPMGQQMPPMGQPPMNQQVPPMGQTVPPMGQAVPPMGQAIPPMGQRLPPMGAPASQPPKQPKVVHRLPPPPPKEPPRPIPPPNPRPDDKKKNKKSKKIVQF